ncbi:unnamed protein product [Adineta ricciae]|uniref:Uncharacterized protein n=1 Tax=Adineta ricciae TaxID=249248 RepID=A0A814MMV9_ADIRI|nr:unnamed protein product [Adineta ricciae]CAF1351797.1 unnamed protein product [Adineta ricciae]
MNSLINSPLLPIELMPWRSAIERLKFQNRVCTTFIPKETNKECCVCNYNHPKSDLPGLNEKWNWKKHTKQETTNSYGILPRSNSPYLRCDIETDLEQLCFVLFGVWNMPVPGLIMRMIGDIDTTPNIKIEKELLKGISDAALASDAWIITNGYKEESISELVGEMVYNSRIRNTCTAFSAIGVGKWGNIHDCHKLEQRNFNMDSMAHTGHGRYKLELNHTQYLFFDDGTCDSLDTGEFASNLARQISRGARRRIPLITILAGGTPHSLSSIYTDLENKIPIVIISKCGPLADLLFKYLKLTENSYKDMSVMDHELNEVQHNSSSDSDDDTDAKMFDEVLSKDHSDLSPSSLTNEKLKRLLKVLGRYRQELINDVRQLYSIVRQQEYESQGRRLPAGELLSVEEEKALENYLYQMASCLNAPFRDNIHLFHTESSESLKETIFPTFVQARNNLSQIKKKFYTTIDEQLHLALRWSIGDATDNQSVATTQIWNDTNKAQQNRLLLIDALSKNMLMFVMNFVKLDIDFTVLFPPATTTSKRIVSRWSRKYHYLEEMYSDAKRINYDPLYLLDQISKKLTFTEEKHLVIVLEKLVGDFMRPLYDGQPDIELVLLGTEIDMENKDNTDAEHIYRDLFLWCILTYRLDMAKIFLGQLKTRICSALIAAKILKSLSAYAPDYVAKDTLYSRADEFEIHAIEFVRHAYMNDKHQACELIMRCTKIYGGVTCLQMAVTADCKRFLHEDACQALLTNIWYDKVDPVREQNILVINILTFGIAQIFLSIYQKHFSKYSGIKPESYMIRSEKPKRLLNKNGIDYTDDYDAHGTVFQHFSHFHNRPVVKYCYSCIGYIFFLTFFSYYMLFAFGPLTKTNHMHWTEILTITTVTTMLFEEFRQVLSQDSRSLMGKIRSYFDLENRISNLVLVLPAYLLFYLGLVLRFTCHTPESFESARIVMAIDLELCFIRSVLFIGIASHLGPKIVMIRKMTNDLLLFIIFIVIFICGYGVTSRSMTAYGSTVFSVQKLFNDIIYPVYYFVHGSIDNERSQLDAKPDISTTVVTQIIFAFHMLFVNVLLINLLIALFSFKINDVQTQARYVWAYDRCDIIRTYHARPALFPPFTFLISSLHVGYRLCKKLYGICFRRGAPYNDQSQCFKMIPMNDDVDYAWSEFERYSTNGYIRELLDDLNTALAKGINTNISSQSASTQVDELSRIKKTISEFQSDLEDTLNDNDDKLDSVKSIITDLKTRVIRMEASSNQTNKQMNDIKTTLDRIMTALINSNIGKFSPPISRDTSRANSLSHKHHSTLTLDRSNQQLTTIDHPVTSQHHDQLAPTNIRITYADQPNNNTDL